MLSASQARTHTRTRTRTRTHAHTHAHTRTGECFGEIALLEETPRTATVRPRLLARTVLPESGCVFERASARPHSRAHAHTHTRTLTLTRARTRARARMHGRTRAIARAQVLVQKDDNVLCLVLDRSRWHPPSLLHGALQRSASCCNSDLSRRSRRPIDC